MKYIYMPDTYNYNLINQNFKNEEDFINAQVKYRMEIEKIIKNYIDFTNIDKYIKSKNIEVPKVLDKEYNFYHKYSTLGSDYIYLRNNYHVENLSTEELEYLINSSNIESNFFNKTIKKVMFENNTFFGSATDENLVSSNSLIFEFSYDQTKCKDLEQLHKIKEIIKDISEKIKTNMKNLFNLNCSFIIYNSIPDYYYNEQNNLIK